MVNGSTATITMRLVRSKLRKREELPTNMDNDKEHQHQHTNQIEDNLKHTTNHMLVTEPGTTNGCNTIIKDHHVTFVRTSGVTTAPAVGHTAGVTDIAEWTFPPKAPAPHIYHINPEMLVANDKNTFKGFRKQFSGRFKRLVARKPEPAPVIPPELKPQLKTIYVY